jgi:hypothetical protein
MAPFYSETGGNWFKLGGNGVAIGSEKDIWALAFPMPRDQIEISAPNHSIIVHKNFGQTCCEQIDMAKGDRRSFFGNGTIAIENPKDEKHEKQFIIFSSEPIR